MTDRATLIRTVCAHPAEMGPRLTYADWLEEQGECDRSEYIRLAIEWNDFDRSPNCECQTGPATNGCPLSHYEKDMNRCDELLSKFRPEWTMAGLPTTQVFGGDGFGWWPNRELIEPPSPTNWTIDDPRPEIKADFRRGFPEILTLRFTEWQRHYRTLIDAMPVREVRLTTYPHIRWKSGPGKVEYFLEGRLTKVNQGGNIWTTGDAMLYLLAAEFPGADPANPIKYSLPQTTEASHEQGTV